MSGLRVGPIGDVWCIQPWTGSEQRSVQGKLLEARSLLDFIPKAEHDAIFARTSTYDCTASIALALSLGTTYGFRVRAPAGKYRHTGISIPNGGQLEGDGIGRTEFHNTHASNTSVAVPYPGSSNFSTYWEFSRATVSAANVKALNQRGISLDTCRHGVVRDVHVRDHYYNVWERAAWSNNFENIHSTGGEYMWHVESGTTGGVPNTRVNINGDSCTYGIDIQNNGLSATLWVGGSVEGMTNWAVSMLGNTNRAISFVGMNFEGNANAGGYDVVLGDDAVATSAASNISFVGCQFNDRSGLSRTCFDMNRGTAFGLEGCNFIGYGKGADLSSNFGSFKLANNGGVSTFADSTNANTVLPMTGSLVGGLSSCCHIATDGKVTIYQSSSSINLLESRRHTEQFSRFEIAADGKIGWHAFNAATADTNLYRTGVGVLKSDHKIVATLGLGVGNSAAATEVIGKAVVKKIEVFDASGTSIGFVPVYSSIT